MMKRTTVSCWESNGDAVVRALASHKCGQRSNSGVDVICGLSIVVGYLPGS